MNASYDVLIIGSGFGGSISAYRLAQAQRNSGKPVSVCVLERGKRYNRGEFPRRLNRTKDWWWRNEGQRGWRGLIDFRSFDNISVVCASGVGGTSLMYLDIQVDAFESTWSQVGPEGQRRWPRSVDWASEMPGYYARVKQMLRPTPIPRPTLKTLALRRGAQAMGAGDRFKLLDVAVYWGQNGSEPGLLHSDPYGRGGPPQAGCVYCGECDIGCNIHAKNTLDLNYLYFAEKAGAEVWSQHQVISIERNPPGHPVHPEGYTISYEDLRFGIRGRVSASMVIVAGGCLGSTELLLRAKHGFVHGKEKIAATLPDLSPRLGDFFSGNGDFGAIASETNRETLPMAGPTITAAVDLREKLGGNGFLIEDGGLPDVVRAGLRRLPGGLSTARRLFSFIRELFARGDARPIVESVFQLLEFEALRDALPFLVMGHDAADGKMSVDEAGKLQIRWPHAASMPYFREVENSLRQLAEQPSGLDGNLAMVPSWSFAKHLITVHPLGGCPMGEDAGDGVVDSHGEVFGYPNLYVLDAAIVPSAIGPNPSKTIGALTERACDHIIRSSPALQ